MEIFGGMRRNTQSHANEQRPALENPVESNPFEVANNEDSEATELTNNR